MCDNLGIDDEKVDVYFIKCNHFDDENIYIGFLKDEAIKYITNYVNDINEDDEELSFDIKLQRMRKNEYENLKEYE